MPKFVLVGDKAYRDPFDAMKAGGTAESPIVSFDVATKINEFFQVQHVVAEGGELKATNVAFVRTADEVLELATKSLAVSVKKIYVYPFEERKKRSDTGVKRVEGSST
jgi:hypothetical protein